MCYYKLLTFYSMQTFIADGASLHSGYRSAGFGETIRDWFRILKNRIVGKWQEWFGNDGPTPSFSPQDIINIDKTIGNRVSGYPGLFLDLCKQFQSNEILELEYVLFPFNSLLHHKVAIHVVLNVKSYVYASL